MRLPGDNAAVDVVADRELRARARALREAAGVSQRQMAAHAGVAQSVLASWEAGRVLVPGAARPEAARRWMAVLRLLDATVTVIFSWPRWVDSWPLQAIPVTRRLRA